MAELLEELKQIPELEFDENADISEILAKYVEEQEIVFVNGRGHRKTAVQRIFEKLTECAERKAKYDLYNSIFDGRNSFSKTDHDATFRRMKDDHMKNGQLKPGYNLQIAVEGEYIVGTDISSYRSDMLTLIPFLKKMDAENILKTGNVFLVFGILFIMSLIALVRISLICPHHVSNNVATKAITIILSIVIDLSNGGISYFNHSTLQQVCVKFSLARCKEK